MRQAGVVVRVLAGEAFGARSPVATLSRLVYLDVKLDAGAAFDLPDTLGDRGVYVIEGDAGPCGGRSYAPARMLVLAPRASGALSVLADWSAARASSSWAASRSSSRASTSGGTSPLSSRGADRPGKTRLARRGGASPGGPFPLVPGDEEEFIPIAE